MSGSAENADADAALLHVWGARPRSRGPRAPGATAEHLFLAMLHDGGWPLSVLTGAGMIDLDQLEMPCWRP